MNDARYRYRHATLRPALLPITLFGTLTTVNLIIGRTPHIIGVFIFSTVVLVIVVAFGALDIEVTDKHVRASYRLGWPARTTPLESIISHQRERNRWWYGIGPRFIPGGRSFTVWGFDTVEIRYRTNRGGERKIRIGTDKITELESAITTQIKRDPQTRPH